MRKVKKAVRKAAKTREKAAAKKIARKTRQAGIVIPSTDEIQKFAPAPRVEGTNLSTISRNLQKAGWPPFEKPPTRLFKYAPPDWTRIWATLADGLVYFTNPEAFNDPYDCRLYPAKTREKMAKELRRANVNIKRHGKAGHDVSNLMSGAERNRHQADILANHESASKNMAEIFLRGMNWGIYCLSEKCDSLPMWAHYAGDHKGVCFVFNPYVKTPKMGVDHFPFYCIWRVKYRKKMRQWNLKSGWMRHFLEKSKEWAYEKEWRALMVDARIETPIRKRRYLPPLREISHGSGTYQHNGTLLGVILGCRMNNSLKREIGRIAAGRGLAVWQSSTKNGEFGLDFEPCNARAREENLHPGKSG